MKRIALFAITAAASAVPFTAIFAVENETSAPAQPVPATAKVDAAELNALLTDSANRIQPHLTSDQRQALAEVKKSLDLR